MCRQTIEIDCPPGDPRPGDLIGDVIKGTGLELREDTSRLFGWWIWDYSDVPTEKWKQLQCILRKRIRSLYNKGIIRGGSC